MKKLPVALFVLFLTQFMVSDLAADDIFSAARRGDLFTVKHYIGKNPDSIAASDPAGYTPLHWAGIRGQWEVFQALVEKGAPVDAVGGDGGSPLHWACHHDRPDMIRLLLDNGADVNRRNRWGRTPLHVTARRGCDLTASLLLSRGADPAMATGEGWTPLHVAYKAGHPRMIELLLASGVSPDLKDKEGLKPAAHAMERPAPVDSDPASLEQYTGIYDLGEHATARVWIEDGGLYLMEFAPDRIYPIGADTFYCVQEPWTVRFVRDEAGGVAGIEIDFLRRTVEGARRPVYEYVGSSVCAECHLGRESGGQNLQWMRSRHAHAYWRLASDWAAFLATLQEKYRDIEQPIEEWRCLKCHVTAQQDQDAVLAESFRMEEGVGCETCHGPGSAYIDPEIMADHELFLKNGGRVPDERTCRQCHQNDRFVYDEWLPKITHPRPAGVESHP